MNRGIYAKYTGKSSVEHDTTVRVAALQLESLIAHEAANPGSFVEVALVPAPLTERDGTEAPVFIVDPDKTAIGCPITLIPVLLLGARRIRRSLEESIDNQTNSTLCGLEVVVCPPSRHAWIGRRKAYLRQDGTSDGNLLLLAREMALARLSLLVRPKTDEAWLHLRWSLQQLRDVTQTSTDSTCRQAAVRALVDALRATLQACARACKKYGRNVPGWQMRRYSVSMWARWGGTPAPGTHSHRAGAAGGSTGGAAAGGKNGDTGISAGGSSSTGGSMEPLPGAASMLCDECELCDAWMDQRPDDLSCLSYRHWLLCQVQGVEHGVGSKESGAALLASWKLRCGSLETACLVTGSKLHPGMLGLERESAGGAKPLGSQTAGAAAASSAPAPAAAAYQYEGHTRHTMKCPELVPRDHGSLARSSLPGHEARASAALAAARRAIAFGRALDRCLEAEIEDRSAGRGRSLKAGVEGGERARSSSSPVLADSLALLSAAGTHAIDSFPPDRTELDAVGRIEGEPSGRDKEDDGHSMPVAITTCVARLAMAWRALALACTELGAGAMERLKVVGVGQVVGCMSALVSRAALLARAARLLMFRGDRAAPEAAVQLRKLLFHSALLCRALDVSAGGSASDCRGCSSPTRVSVRAAKAAEGEQASAREQSRGEVGEAAETDDSCTAAPKEMSRLAQAVDDFEAVVDQLHAAVGQVAWVRAGGTGGGSGGDSVASHRLSLMQRQEQ